MSRYAKSSQILCLQTNILLKKFILLAQHCIIGRQIKLSNWPLSYSIITEVINYRKKLRFGNVKPVNCS